VNAPAFHAQWRLLHVLPALSVLAFAAPAVDEIPAHQARQIFDAAPSQARVVPRKPRRVLIWNTPAHLMEKDPHKGYCIPYGSSALEAIGQKAGAYEPVVSDDLAVYLPANLRRFDAIVMNNSSGPWMTPTDADLAKDAFKRHGTDKVAVEQVLRQSLLDFVRDGGGLVSLHFAIAANAHWPEFKELLGAAFTGHPWNEEIGVKVEEPNHPVVAAFGGNDFRLADEIYEYGPPYDRSKLRVLLSLNPTRSNMGVRWITRKDNDFALAWVKSYGQGRVFNTSFGHRTELFWDPRVLAFYLDAIQFATGDLEAPTAPRPARTVRPVAGTDPVSAWPGSNPGSAQVWISNSSGGVNNRVLSAAWSFSERGLQGGFLRDQQTGRSLTLTGEVFQVVLKDGTRYPASELRSVGTPTIVELKPRPAASRFAERMPGRKIEVRLSAADGRLGVMWRALALDQANYIRQEIEITALKEDLGLREVVWFQQPVPDASTAGTVDGSPVVASPFFLGCEDPMALNQVGVPEGGVICRLPRDASLRRGETLTSSFALGVAPAGQMRRAFLDYLERERAHPYRPFLHYNSWYDTAWDPFALNETNCLEAIRLCGDRLINAHGVVMDGMVFDDGWDDPKTLWQFHRGFPDGFRPLAELCRNYHTRLGVWLSPFGGYGVPKEQRLKFGGEQGFETNATGFSLAGPRYYAAFKQSCVNMIVRFGVNHFKFDGIAAGMNANGGAEYVRDTEAMRRLMLELRQEDPNLYLNLTTGSWPSPFWLRYADSVWRQGGDMGHAGKGPKQQQWLTYRDQETYRNIVRKGPLFPLNSLMTQGVAYSRRGPAGDPSFNSAGFQDDVRAFFGSGTGLQELYIQPGKLTADDWAVLAEAANWSRANADVLVDTHWIGGDPGKLEVYGYASWTVRKGIVTLRNPDDQPHEFALDVGVAFELPAGAATKFKLGSPWAEDARKPVLPAESGTPLRLELKPFEIVVLDTVPSS